MAVRIAAGLALLAVFSTQASAAVVGKVGRHYILKTESGWIVTTNPRKQNNTSSQPSHPSSVSRTSSFEEIIKALKEGKGDKVYTRINGFNVERILDRGSFFGAVISGKVSRKALEKVFQYVEKYEGKYYVVGKWE